MDDKPNRERDAGFTLVDQREAGFTLVGWAARSVRRVDV
jgi:hypothetical protein